MCGAVCRLRGYNDIDFGHGPPQGLTGVICVHWMRVVAVLPTPDGPALRMAVSPAMLARLKASAVFRLLGHSHFQE